jgi:cell division protein FtsZ
MSNSIRVTVVATGLGREAQRQETPIRMVRPALAAAAAGGLEHPSYAGFEPPAVRRRTATGDTSPPPPEANFELLDVPAFLRRQAD